MSEQWTHSPDDASATVSGRVLQPWYKKINPIWWFLNDEEPTPPADYKPASAQWWRMISWYLRNPLQNFGKYVVGVYDRNYTVVGTAPVTVTAWNDLPGNITGWKWSVIKIGWLRLPFVSYVGTHVMWYVGFQWWGFLGAKFNLLDSELQVV